MLPQQIVEWTLQKDEATVQCVRSRLPGGVIAVALIFGGLEVNSCLSATQADADRWSEAVRSSWEGAGWRAARAPEDVTESAAT
jgi:hypothetical protein